MENSKQIKTFEAEDIETLTAFVDAGAERISTKGDFALELQKIFKFADLFFIAGLSFGGAETIFTTIIDWINNTANQSVLPKVALFNKKYLQVTKKYKIVSAENIGNDFEGREPIVIIERKKRFFKNSPIRDKASMKNLLNGLNSSRINTMEKSEQQSVAVTSIEELYEYSKAKVQHINAKGEFTVKLYKMFKAEKVMHYVGIALGVGVGLSSGILDRFFNFSMPDFMPMIGVRPSSDILDRFFNFSMPDFMPMLILLIAVSLAIFALFNRKYIQITKRYKIVSAENMDDEFSGGEPSLEIERKKRFSR